MPLFNVLKQTHLTTNDGLVITASRRGRKFSKIIMEMMSFLLNFRLNVISLIKKTVLRPSFWTVFGSRQGFL